MIRYSLACDKDHGFDGWFRNADDFDKQAKKGLVQCPSCGSVKVHKALMAPAVSTAESRAAMVAPAEASDAGKEAPMASFAAPDPRRQEFLEMMRNVRKVVTENSTYVGDKFAEEARRIHYEETEKKGIYGEASPDEVRALAEEGIEFHPLPILPEDKN